MGNVVQLCFASSVWLQMMFCSCVNEPRFYRSCDRSCVKMADRFASRIYSLKNKLGDRMIKQLLNLVIVKYRVLSVSRRSIICRSRGLRQMIDLLATDKSRDFAQPRPIIVNYSMAESTGAQVDQANPACVVCVQIGYLSRQD